MRQSRYKIKYKKLDYKISSMNRIFTKTTKFFKPMTDGIKNTSEKITKTLTENYINNKKTIEKLNEKILELLNDKGLIAPYLTSSLVNLFEPENRSQFESKKDLNSTKMNDFLMNESIPVTLFSIMLVFRDINKSFKLDGDLLKVITIFKFNADHSNPQDKKLNYEFTKEMNFDIKKVGRPSTRDKSVKRILDSPAIMASGL